ncbi:putative integral membrane protein [Theileria parva strain Muguga]|uniref:Protein YIPF n=1 Tax=Theileria parva TaxID=5875 RepID=Q4N7N4_THEPA|nr:putative integral membrane protein [Theileria parva strain Muguga]EAN34024.1 putative integral membrane protein [Theileria parva strain Muguga]|eukprot:XP_766307.1 hypothetical protein [Theileria parva strain Muguga]
MTGNLRPRRAYHNAFGDEVQDTQNKQQFPTQGREVFTNPTQSHNIPFQNQGSFHNFPAQNSFTNTGNSFVPTDDGKGNLNPRPFNTVPNVVSSPFSQNQPTNIPASPFRTTSVPTQSFNPNAIPTQTFNQNTIPTQSFNYNPNFNANVTTSLNPNTNVLNQSQSLEDRSKMYLEGQFSPNTTTKTVFPKTTTTLPFSQSATTQQPFAQTTTTRQFPQNGPANSNPLRPNITNTNLANNVFSPFQAQLGAQLTKFGEMYTQRLQQSEEEDVVDPPLLDELGINVVEIYEHLLSVVLPKKGNSLFLNYNDLSGPLLIFVTFALGLMFSGKICFSIIYVLSVFCNLGIYLLFNFLNEQYISLSKTVTIMGYSLLPLCLTPVIWLFSRFLKFLSVILVYSCVVWSTVSATYLFQAELNLGSRFYFVVYPILLYYTTFANIVIF